MTEPEMKPVQSTMLTSLGFDVESFTLFARYNNGSLYAYEDISPEQYEQIIGDPESVGKAFNRIVRAQGRPAGTKLEDAKPKESYSFKDVKSRVESTTFTSGGHEQQFPGQWDGRSEQTPPASLNPQPIVDELPPPIVEPTTFDTQEKAVETALTVASKFAMLTISNLDERHRASQLLVEIERERKARVEWFKPIKQSAHATWKGICERENEALNPLIAARTSLEALMSGYDREEQRQRREQEERIRLQREKEERERAQKEAEDRRLREAETLETQGRHEEVTRVLSEPIVPQMRPQPAVILPKQTSNTKGVSAQKKYSFRIDDAMLLPRKYLMPDESAIRKVVNALGLDAEIPGVSVSDGSGYRVNTKHADSSAKKGGKG